MARKVPEAAFEAWLDKLQSRMNAHEPSTRTDVALRRQLEAWERMARGGSEPLAPMIRTVKGLGTLEGLKFIKTGPHGMDVYEATFSKGDLRCSIMALSSAGEVNGSSVIRPFARGLDTLSSASGSEVNAAPGVHWRELSEG